MRKTLFPIFLVLFEVCIYLSNDMYIPGLPAIEREFAASRELAQATLSLWFFGVASLQLVLGPLSDRFGRRPLLLSGAGLFIASTLMCVLAPNIGIFLVGRFLEGASIGFLVIGYSAIHESYGSHAAVKITALMGSVAVMAPTLGPLAGALVLEMASWRATFWVLIAGSAVALAGLTLVMEETCDKKPSSIQEIVGGYRLLFSNRQFMLLNVMFGLIFSIFFIWITVSPFIIMQLYGKSGLYFGVVQCFVCGSCLIGQFIARKTVGRYQVRHLIRAALVSLLVASGLLVVVAFAWPDCLPLIVGFMVLVGVSVTTMFAPLGRLSVESSTEPMGRKQALGSTVFNVVGSSVVALATLLKPETFLGLSIVIACLAAGAAAVYRCLHESALKFKK